MCNNKIYNRPEIMLQYKGELAVHVHVVRRSKT